MSVLPARADDADTTSSLSWASFAEPREGFFLSLEEVSKQEQKQKKPKPKPKTITKTKKKKKQNQNPKPKTKKPKPKQKQKPKPKKKQSLSLYSWRLVAIYGVVLVWSSCMVQS
jgi:hypothetical protein